MKAVIIAAGCGSRLQGKHQGSPKTLLEIGNRRVIDYILEKINNCSIMDVIIITGYEATQLEEALADYKGNHINIQFKYNKNWQKPNGLSVLCAQEFIHVDENFILLMNDHIFQQGMLDSIVKTDMTSEEALLAIDFKLSKIPDLEDGMKVRCNGIGDGRYIVRGLNKQYVHFQAIDCGMFKLNYSFFSVLDECIANGEYSLADACNVLARREKMIGIDIQGQYWIDLDTLEMFEFHDILEKII